MNNIGPQLELRAIVRNKMLNPYFRTDLINEVSTSLLDVNLLGLLGHLDMKGAVHRYL
ncbi:MAG: hypothetical protein VYA34_16620 [Myxococcota bacterium]|nr:hypothetical protein [Myxococcota bacterium]